MDSRSRQTRAVLDSKDPGAVSLSDPAFCSHLSLAALALEGEMMVNFSWHSSKSDLTSYYKLVTLKRGNSDNFLYFDLHLHPAISYSVTKAKDREVSTEPHLGWTDGDLWQGQGVRHLNAPQSFRSLCLSKTELFLREILASESDQASNPSTLTSAKGLGGIIIFNLEN